MKNLINRVSIITFLLITILFCSSCDKKKALFSDLRDLIENVIENGDNFTQTEWDESIKEFERIELEMTNYSLTEDETKTYSKLKTIFYKEIATHKISSGIKDIKDVFYQIKGVFDGLQSDSI